MNSPVYFLGKMAQRANQGVARVLKEAGLQLDRGGSKFQNDIAYLQELSRHKQFTAIEESSPKVDSAWIAPNATLVGEVLISKWASVWAEYNAVRVGHFSSIGDGTTINTACALPHGVAASVNIGKNPGCTIYSCIIDDDVVIGQGSVIMGGARIERGAHVLPNSIVQPGRLIPAGQVWGGNPVKFVRHLTQEEQVQNYARSYTNTASEFESDTLYPHDYQTGDLKQGQLPIEEYAHKKYFRNLDA